MRNVVKRVGLVAGLLGASVPATAHASDAYWNQLCTNGGWTFNTCASAWVTATGNQVTLRIWNLTGLPGSNTFANAGFTAVGLRNIGSGLVFKNLQAYRPNGTSYAGWGFAQGNNGIPGPSGANGVSLNGIGNAIFSQYATSIPGNGTPAITNWGGSGNFTGGFVSFVFDAFTQQQQQVCSQSQQRVRDRLQWVTSCQTQWVDVPATIDLTNAILGLHVQSGPNGQSTGYECAADNSNGGGLSSPCLTVPPPTVTPEPVTTALLSTGLIGMALVDIRRRRRRNQTR